MKIRPVGDNLFHADERTDGRTGGRADRESCMTKLSVAFHNFPNSPKNASVWRTEALTNTA